MPAILIDTDIGDDIDDVFALPFALRSPELELLGVTTVSGDVTQRSRLARKMLATFGRPEIPVAVGEAQPLARRDPSSGCGLGRVLIPGEPLPPPYSGGATQLMCDTALARPGEVTIVALGTLTNVATAFRAEPLLAGKLAGVVMMNSAAVPWWEWNARSDPEALRIVVHSNAMVDCVGLNVTTPYRLSRVHVQALAAQNTAEAQLLSQLLTFWHPGEVDKRPPLHDVLTVAAVARPELVTFSPASISCVREGPLRGLSWACPSWPRRSRVAVFARGAAFLRLVAERLVEA